MQKIILCIFLSVSILYAKPLNLEGVEEYQLFCQDKLSLPDLSDRISSAPNSLIQLSKLFYSDKS